MIIECDPDLVGEDDATVSLTFTPISNYEEGQYIYVVFPDAMSIQTGARTCSLEIFDTDDTLTPSYCRATSSTQLWMKIDQDITADGDAISISFDGVSTPGSSKETETFELYVHSTLSTTSTVIDFKSDGI